MNWNSQTRRMFLRGTGNFMLSIPLLPSLMPSNLWAADLGFISRYILISSELDYGVHTNWYPTNQRPANVLPKLDQRPVYYQPLKSYLGSKRELSPILTSGLNPYLGQINLLRGLDHMSRYAHGAGVNLGNLADNHPNANGVLDGLRDIRTIDNVINDSPNFNPGKREAPLLGQNDNTTSFGYNSAKQVKGKAYANSSSAFRYGTPQALFEKYFRGIADSSTTPTAPATPTAPHMDVVSRVLEDYNRAKNSRKISSADKQVLDTTLDRLNDLQKSLTSPTHPTSAACKPGDVPNRAAALAQNQTWTLDRLGQVYKSYVDVVVMAMICDTMRVCTFFDGLTASGTYPMWSSISKCGVGSAFHEKVSHVPFGSSGGVSNLTHLARYGNHTVTSILIPLLEKMSEVTDPNGKTMLYNSLVHMTKESSLNHSFMSAPCLLAGNAGGRLKSGYLIDYMDRSLPVLPPSGGSFNPDTGYLEGGHYLSPTHPRFVWNWPGVQYNRLFVTIFRALGLSPSDYAASYDAKGIVTKGGYGYINAAYPPSGYPFHDATWTKTNQNRYDYNLSGSPLQMPTQDAT